MVSCRGRREEGGGSACGSGGVAPLKLFFRVKDSGFWVRCAPRVLLETLVAGSKIISWTYSARGGGGRGGGLWRMRLTPLRPLFLLSFSSSPDLPFSCSVLCNTFGMLLYNSQLCLLLFLHQQPSLSLSLSLFAAVNPLFLSPAVNPLSPLLSCQIIKKKKMHKNLESERWRAGGGDLMESVRRVWTMGVDHKEWDERLGLFETWNKHLANSFLHIPFNPSLLFSFCLSFSHHFTPLFCMSGIRAVV